MRDLASPLDLQSTLHIINFLLGLLAHVVCSQVSGAFSSALWILGELPLLNASLAVRQMVF